MIKTLDLEKMIINTISKRYEVEVATDEELDIGDETNLCLRIKNKYFDINLVKEDFKDMNIRIVKYGNLIIFN